MLIQGKLFSVKNKLSFFLIVFLFPFVTHVTTGSSTSDFSGLEAKLNAIKESYNIPTVHVAITRNREVLWTKGIGNQVSPETVFLIASIQKPFVATAILQLYEQGLVDLDTDISDYLPFEVRHPSYPEEDITLRMLLTHTSGLASVLYYEFYWDTEGKFSTYRGEFNPSVLTMDLGQFLNESFTPGGANYYSSVWIHRPGERYSYSNPGFKLLHYLVECVTQESFEDYLQENVFTPLQMVNSGINATNFTSNHATPFTRRFGVIEELEIYSSWQIRSSATDMAHFLIAHLNKGHYEDQQILQSSSVALMHSETIRYSEHRNDLFQDVNNYRFYQHSYGLGWSYFHDEFEGHGGSTPGFISVMAGRSSPDGSSVGIILFMNLNALFGSSDDITEVHSAYYQLVNTVLFDLNLIPFVNQEFVDLYIFFATIWLTFCLIIYTTVQLLDKEPITTRYYSWGGNSHFKILPLVFGLIAVIIGINFFSYNDWRRVLLFVPSAGYFGVLFITNIFFSSNHQDKFSPLFHNFKSMNSVFLLNSWIILNLIGLGLYNSYYSFFFPLIPGILCICSILLILFSTLYWLKEKKSQV